MADVIWGYACNECDLFHEEEEDAINCCPVDTNQAYQCSECGLHYYILASAVTCCPDEVPENLENDCAA